MQSMVLSCGCQVNYYPNQAFIGGIPQPHYVSHGPCAAHYGISNHPAVLAECAKIFEGTP